jgi:hypothetical protein
MPLLRSWVYATVLALGFLLALTGLTAASTTDQHSTHVHSVAEIDDIIDRLLDQSLKGLFDEGQRHWAGTCQLLSCTHSPSPSPNANPTICSTVVRPFPGCP